MSLFKTLFSGFYIHDCDVGSKGRAELDMTPDKRQAEHELVNIETIIMDDGLF